MTETTFIPAPAESWLMTFAPEDGFDLHHLLGWLHTADRRSSGAPVAVGSGAADAAIVTRANYYARELIWGPVTESDARERLTAWASTIGTAFDAAVDRAILRLKRDLESSAHGAVEVADSSHATSEAANRLVVAGVARWGAETNAGCLLERGGEEVDQ